MDEGQHLASWSFLRKEVTLNGGHVRRILDLGPGSIPRGRLVCILGPSGCGKTSLLAILGLVDHEFESDLTLELGEARQTVGHWRPRRRMRESERLRRRIGFVFQEMRLRAGASACENVIDPMLYLGIGSRKERVVHARNMLTLFGLPPDDLNRPISSFSGGMQQRTGLARALAIGPDLIIADEPTAHVDDRMADAIYTDLKRRSAERGITVVVATHNEDMALRHADHIIRFEPLYEDEDVARGAREQGEWPYQIRVEREARGIEGGEAAKSGLERASASTSFADMGRVALAEFLPLVRVTGRALRTVGWGWAVAGLRALRGLPPPRRDRIAPHRYLPLLVSIVTFGLLAAMGFSLYGMKAAILSYQQEKLDALDGLRRVRVEDPGDIEGNAIRIDAEDVRRFAQERGVPIVESSPVYDLGGEALIPAELEFLRNNAQWAPVQAAGLADPTSVDDRDRGARRTFFTLVGVTPGEPQANDMGLPPEDHRLSSADGELPDLWIPRNEWEWLYGNFDALPEPGDVVGLLFSPATQLTRGPDAAVDALPPATCVRFRVGGYLSPRRAPTGFVSEIQKKFYKGVIHTAAMQRILAWQADPLNAGKALPEAWRCDGTPAGFDAWQYLRPDESRDPMASEFDFFAATPGEALRLERVLEDYAIERGIVFGGVTSERGFIEQVSRLIRLAEFVGFVLHVLPIAVGGVILWLVVHEILFRRREDLLLFRVMGAPSLHLHVQSLVLSMMVVLPGVLIGFLLGRAGPRLMVGFMAAETMPTELVGHLSAVNIGLVGLLETAAAAGLCALLASVTVVKSILASNPASAFRGMQ